MYEILGMCYLLCICPLLRLLYGLFSFQVWAVVDSSRVNIYKITFFNVIMTSKFGVIYVVHTGIFGILL